MRSNLLTRLLARIRRDSRGTAAEEFVIIMPIALIMFTGAVTYGDAIAIDRKVTLTAHTVADLTTQYSTLTAAQMTALLNAATAIIAPYASANIVVTVSEVQTNASSVATVTWSQSLNGTARTVGSSVTLPTSLSAANVTYIWGEATYTYTPKVGYQVTGPITLYQQTYMAPRLSTAITLN
jgi:Flp pilus assembly protein TadG